MAEQVKLSYDYPRFFEAIADVSLPPDVAVSFRNFVREIEKLQKSINQVVNLNVGDLDWIDASYTANWSTFSAAFDDAGYMKIGQDLVLLRGLVKSSGAIPDTIFTLPAGYRPAKTKLFAALSNGAVGRIDVNSSGAVIAQVPSAVNWVQLDGLIFRADA